MKKLIALNEALNMLSVKDIIEPLVTGEADEVEEIGNQVFSILVPANGKASTVAGEIFRAVNKICSRFFNDGDIAGHRCGNVTVNPAVRYLEELSGRDDIHFDSKFIRDIQYFMNCVDGGGDMDEDRYKRVLNRLYKNALFNIYNGELYTKPNYDDMLDFKNEKYDIDDSWEDEEWEEYEEENESLMLESKRTKSQHRKAKRRRRKSANLAKNDNVIILMPPPAPHGFGHRIPNGPKPGPMPMSRM